ncbi:MAG: HPr family phosphocarrier protein [Deltaproteobacteria bacterium]|nr:HPr family phosphocarrier protein [Deltaproteobacteria bacterium]
MGEIQRQVKIINELGLHARAASKLVQLAAKYPVDIRIGRSDMMVDAKSIMGVLMLAACRGTELDLQASGDDGECEKALDEIQILFGDLFGEGK